MKPNINELIAALKPGEKQMTVTESPELAETTALLWARAFANPHGALRYYAGRFTPAGRDDGLCFYTDGPMVFMYKPPASLFTRALRNVRRILRINGGK